MRSHAPHSTARPAPLRHPRGPVIVDVIVIVIVDVIAPVIVIALVNGNDTVDVTDAVNDHEL